MGHSARNQDERVVYHAFKEVKKFVESARGGDLGSRLSE